MKWVNVRVKNDFVGEREGANAFETTREGLIVLDFVNVCVRGRLMCGV